MCLRNISNAQTHPASLRVAELCMEDISVVQRALGILGGRGRGREGGGG